MYRTGLGYREMHGGRDCCEVEQDRSLCAVVARRLTPTFNVYFVTCLSLQLKHFDFPYKPISMADEGFC